MTKIGRNTPCPCRSGKKYKRCCMQKETEMRQAELPAGRFRYESGSYGGLGRGFMALIYCIFNKFISFPRPAGEAKHAED